MSPYVRIDDAVRADEAAVEVELSPDELLALSRTPTPVPRSRRASRPTASRAVIAVAAAMGVVVASTLVLVALHAGDGTVTGKQDRSASAGRLAVAPAAVAMARPTVSPSAAAAVPVRYTNPFDRSEVFEFPPGTSRREAHDAVADILFKRAQERLQRQHARLAALHRARTGPAVTAQLR